MLKVLHETIKVNNESLFLRVHLHLCDHNLYLSHKALQYIHYNATPQGITFKKYIIKSFILEQHALTYNKTRKEY